MALVLFSARLGCALAFGRLTLMPCTVAVVRMMKMMSSTYARSSIGVMLISSYTSLSPPPPAIVISLRVRLGDARDELVDEHVVVGADLLDARVQVVVAEQARDGDAE